MPAYEIYTADGTLCWRGGAIIGYQQGGGAERDRRIYGEIDEASLIKKAIAAAPFRVDGSKAGPGDFQIKTIKTTAEYEQSIARQKTLGMPRLDGTREAHGTWEEKMNNTLNPSEKESGA